MESLYTEYPNRSLFLMAYIVLSFIKVVVCLASLPAASAAFQRKMPGLSMPIAVTTMVIGIVLVAPFIVLPSLRHEGARFFFAYSNRTVIRQVFNGF